MAENTISIYVIDREGQEHELNAPTNINLNVMEVCRMYELPVEGRCGGMAMCATCQVYLEMITVPFFVKDNSLLGCHQHYGRD